jgi:hypothetical protein
VLGQSQFLSSSIFHHPKEKEQFMLLGDRSIVLLWWWMLAQRVLTLYLTLTLGVETYLLFQQPTCPQIFNPNNTRQTGVLKRKEKKKPGAHHQVLLIIAQELCLV